jgi:hypothetical protein
MREPDITFTIMKNFKAIDKVWLIRFKSVLLLKDAWEWQVLKHIVLILIWKLF